MPPMLLCQPICSNAPVNLYKKKCIILKTLGKHYSQLQQLILHTLVHSNESHISCILNSRASFDWMQRVKVVAVYLPLFPLFVSTHNKHCGSCIVRTPTLERVKSASSCSSSKAYSLLLNSSECWALTNFMVSSSFAPSVMHQWGKKSCTGFTKVTPSMLMYTTTEPSL